MFEDPLDELKSFLIPTHLPENRFKNFIRYLENELNKKNHIKHQALCRAVRRACGLAADASPENYPSTFPFDRSAAEATVFVKALRVELNIFSKRKLELEYLFNTVAVVLDFRSWPDLLLTFSLYESIRENDWSISGKRIKKPLNFQQLDWIFMPGYTTDRYGNTVPGKRYRISHLKGGSYKAALWSEFYIFPNGGRDWGDSELDALYWIIATTFPQYGLKSWNLYMGAQKWELTEDKMWSKLSRAKSAEEVWVGSTERKLLHEYVLKKNEENLKVLI